MNRVVMRDAFEADFIAGAKLAEDGEIDGGDGRDNGVAASGGVVCTEDDGVAFGRDLDCTVWCRLRGHSSCKRRGDLRAFEPQAHAVRAVTDAMRGVPERLGICKIVVLRAGDCTERARCAMVIKESIERAKVCGAWRGVDVDCERQNIACLQWSTGMAAELAEKIGRTRTQNTRNINAATDRKISTATLVDPADGKRVFACDAGGAVGDDAGRCAITRQLHVCNAARDRDDGFCSKLHDAAHQRHLKNCSVVCIAHEPVCDACREQVHRAGGRDALRCMAEASEILHGREHAGLDNRA